MSRDLLRVAPLSTPFVGYIVEYLTALSDDDLARMGMLRERIPSAERLGLALKRSIDAPLRQRREAYLLWMRDDQPVGYAALKRIQFGLYGDMHLHLVAGHERGRGLGARLFCLSVLEFYRSYRLKLCLCEPKASNRGPNRMLQKVGFPLLKSFCGCSSELTYPAEISQYLITKEVAQGFLGSQTVRSQP